MPVFNQPNSKGSRAHLQNLLRGFPQPRIRGDLSPAVHIMRYFATTPKGIEPILQQELEQLGATDVTPSRGGVHFSGDLSLALRANLWLRSAMRILEPLAENIPSRDAEELYESARKIRWHERLTQRSTLAVEANGKNPNLTHTHFTALKVKDAIVDQLRSAYGSRPNINTYNPDVHVIVHIEQDKASIYVNLSGESLHRRGYRAAQTDAPLKESLAAALLLWAGYKGDVPLHDPMCGSGTFAIEAALIALGRAPNANRGFAFERWPSFSAQDAALLRDLRKQAQGNDTLPFPIFASDVSNRAVQIAQKNIRSFGLDRHIQCSTMDVLQTRPLSPAGLIASNPPYGERLGETAEELLPFYKQLGEHWKTFGNHNILLLSGTNKQERAVGMFPQKKLKVFNGPIECTAALYNVWDISHRPKQQG
jgi:putative N6-adenine-specific DNA methylase